MPSRTASTISVRLTAAGRPVVVPNHADDDGTPAGQIKPLLANITKPSDGQLENLFAT